jgi:signal transduction histidine kinase
LTVLAIGVLVAGVAASAAAMRGVADHGVDADVAGMLTAVSPTGYAWAAGLRPGQVIDVVIAVDEPGGWRMETLDGSTRRVADGPAADGALRSSLPAGLAGLIGGYLAVIFLRTRRRWVLPTAALALASSSIPLQFEGGAGLPTLVMAGAALVPTSAFVVRVPGGIGVRAGAAIILAVLAIAWVGARLSGADWYVDAEGIRTVVVVAATLALVLERTVVEAMSGHPIRLVRPRIFEVVVVGGVAVLALIVGHVLNLPPLVTALLFVAALAVVAPLRRRMAAPLELALFRDVREQAAAEASEAERAKLARELHDVPLQELAAVIRRLEILPGAEAESEDLRTLAGHLRNVATELRPPVLDDLGLPAALEFLAEEAATPSVPVGAEVVDDTGFGAERRPPTDVELPLYRIASEAVANAVRHSGGSRVDVRALVAPDRVELTIADDGAGLAPEAASQAARRKRLGLASMRRRAEAVDAELSIDASSSGTTVRVVWRA